MTRTWQFFLYFLRLGCVGFGGPLALIAQMQKDLVEKEQVMKLEDFRLAFSLIKSMPGPVAFQMAYFIAAQKLGRAGASLAAIALVVPAALLMVLLVEFQTLFTELFQTFQTALTGLELGAIALMGYAIKGLSSGFERDGTFWYFAVLVGFVHIVWRWPEPILILGAAALSYGYWRYRMQLSEWGSVLLMAWVCFQAGAVNFGTGISILPLLKADFVDQYQWVTESQFWQAIAFGNLTPGPISVSVTYLGYLKFGVAGAVLGTAAIFFASWFHHVTWFPHAYHRLKSFSGLAHFTKGATAAVVALLGVTLWQMLEKLPVEQQLLFAAAMALIWLTRLGSLPFLLICGLAGYLFL